MKVAPAGDVSGPGAAAGVDWATAHDAAATLRTRAPAPAAMLRTRLPIGINLHAWLNIVNVAFEVIPIMVVDGVMDRHTGWRRPG